MEGADVNATDKVFFLHLSKCHDRTIRMNEFIIQDGNSSLLMAVFNYHISIAEILIKAGADINAKNNVSAIIISALKCWFNGNI